MIALPCWGVFPACWTQFDPAPRAGSDILLTKGDLWQNHTHYKNQR